MHLFLIFCPNASTLIDEVPATPSDIDTAVQAEETSDKDDTSDIDTAVQAEETSVEDDLEITASTEEDIGTDQAVTTTIDGVAAVPLDVATAVQADESLDNAAADDDLEITALTEEDIATDQAVTTTIDEVAAVPLDVATAVQADEILDNAAAYVSPYFFDAAGRRGQRLFEAFRLHQIEVRRLNLVPKEIPNPRHIDFVELEAKHDQTVADILAGRRRPQPNEYQEIFQIMSHHYDTHYDSYQARLAADRERERSRLGFIEQRERFRLERLSNTRKSSRLRDNAESSSQCLVPLFPQSDAEPAATVAQGMLIFHLHCLQFLTKYIRQLLDSIK
jgi:hypothetical protein